MKCNKRLKYNNYVAFSHFHGTAVNNSGLIITIVEINHRSVILINSNFVLVSIIDIGIFLYVFY